MLTKPASVIISGLFLLNSCDFSQYDKTVFINRTPHNSSTERDTSYATISTIPVPTGFSRFPSDDASFSNWLGKIKLKKDRTVYLYNGEIKRFQNAQFAVLDISVGKKDLQQCADAVMRLRAEYLLANKRYREISFSDNDGTAYSLKSLFTAENFADYLNKVFSACGTASLSKQLHSKSIKDLQPGDVLIRGGFPGHAVIVVDAAINFEKEIVYMLAQSYMPAQDIHILRNPTLQTFSPWYKIDGSQRIITPEYVFSPTELKSW